MDRETRTRRRRKNPAPARGSGLGPERRYGFLASASRDLASSLDYEETLAGVAGRQLPFLGAWCIVDLLEEGRIRRVAILHPDPEKRRLVDQLRADWPPSRDDPFGIPTVMRSGKPELVTDVTDELLAEVAQNEENLRILRELRMGSLITVPMSGRGEVIGAITYVAPEAGRAFTDSDVTLAEDLATLSALAVENARLHDEANRAAREAGARRSEAERLAALAGQVNERLLLSAVSELEAAEQAQVTEEAKSEFMTSLSHELRTPLDAIGGYTELLLMGHEGPISEKQAASLERVQSAAQHILALVDQILAYARANANREPVHLGQVDVAGVARDALGLIEPLAARKGLVLRPDIPTGPLVLWTDEEKVRQILLNLLSNATRFTDEGEVRLEVRAEAQGLRLRVSDTGPGIAEKDLPRIFERFFQAAGGTRVVGLGSGLGLAITRALVDLLEGDITIESELGRGTTFSVFLPSVPPGPRNAEDEAGLRSSGDDTA